MAAQDYVGGGVLVEAFICRCRTTCVLPTPFKRVLCLLLVTFDRFAYISHKCVSRGIAFSIHDERAAEQLEKEEAWRKQRLARLPCNCF
eukprot:2003436-Amphidinium_carterae.1